MRAKRPILLGFLNVLTSLNDFIIKRIVFLFLVKYIASRTLMSVFNLLYRNSFELSSIFDIFASIFIEH